MRFFTTCLRAFFLLVLVQLASPAAAGIVRGRILSVKGEALAFANVAVKGTTLNTASNEQGNYQLRLTPGSYELVFQYVGFKPRLETVRVAGGDTATVLNVSLTPENYQLREVVVRSTDKDPAYSIVQQAMQWRRYHQREVAAFKARAYIKTLGRFTDVPGKILGLVKVGPDFKPGIFYLSESVSEMSFRQPNVVQERMISSRVSGDTKGISFNRASAGRGLNFYQNVLKSGFSERGFVSPIAANAPLFYRFELEGSTQQGSLLIHKIKVIPRRRTDPVFAGHIYIVDGTWRLHSVSLDLSKDAQLDYVDNLHIEQIFAPAPGPSDVWVMQSQKVTVGFTAFGFKGNGYITAILSNYRVTPTYPNRPAPTAPPAATGKEPDDAPVTRETVAQVKKQKPKLDGLTRTVRRQSREAAARDTAGLGLGRLKRGEVMLVEKGVNERDTSYWATIRPVPLTQEEQKDYQVKDSTEVIRNSRSYQDSLDRKRNEVSISKFLLTGYSYNNTFRKRQWYVAPVFNIVNYNTVEGVVVNPQATYTQRTDDRRTWSVTPALRYGFSNQLVSPSVAASWQLDAVKLARLSLQAGRTIENFDPRTQLTPFINSYYTLFNNRNYAKLYRRDGLELGYQWEPLNGLTVQATGSYFVRRELENTTYKLITDQPGRAFTPNVPVSAERPDGTQFGRSQALTTELTASFRPGQRYITRPNGKFNLGSKYPTFLLTWRQGIGGILNSDVRYTLLEAGIRHSVSLGLLGTSSYQVAAGFFPGSSTRLAFMDFRHFSGNRTYLTEDFAKFQLLNYYRFSTADQFLEAHYNHHFNGFLLNKLPVLRRLHWQEVASLNYLTTPTANHYLELGVGIEHIFKLLRVDFYTSLQSGQRAGTGIRVGFGF
ncbi:carboxypeptidase-like regulatory domain-containing protein [Hymenobacter metallilatus]|uniref:Carboxypeptidase-like regulatory domain-containing protein n=1 Tax=Hymenobacter metallilatus TaxID=2493666 RepID=A0A3R9NE86_9BACT|nr:carboxypeptidase-like regulatory domain-containing protein [Hymenobacter metallilatus]